jgi:uncharacterized membrane protein
MRMSRSENGISASPQAALRPPPIVRAATVADVVAAVEAGLRDLRAAPRFGLFFGAFYTFGGMLIVYLTGALGLTWIAMPLTAGFVLLGPFVAVGLYEVSRRREAGEPISFAAVLGCMVGQGKRELAWMAFVSVFAFIVWMYQIRILYAFFFGFAVLPASDVFRTLLTTSHGLAFLGIGTLWGAVLSVVIFTLTVVSFPLLLERDRDFITAMITSVKAVVASPVVMVGWGLMTGGLIVLAAMPFFLGFIVVLPVLGHATWHLYRRIVLPETTAERQAPATGATTMQDVT